MRRFEHRIKIVLRLRDSKKINETVALTDKKKMTSLLFCIPFSDERALDWRACLYSSDSRYLIAQ